MKSFIKSNLLIAISLSVLFFTSCEDSEGDKANSDLIGTWTVDETAFDVTVDGVDLTTYLMNTFTISETEAQVFTDLITADFGAGPAGTITIKDDYTYQTNMTDGMENGTWALSSDGNTLTITGTDDDGTEYTDNMTIVSLSSSLLVLSLPVESEEYDLDEDGVNETIMDFSMELTFTK